MKIHKIISLAIVANLTVTSCFKTESPDYADYVDPMIGTDFHGHTFPGAALPGGMVQLSPDTGTEDWDWCSGYHYSDISLMGFSHLHRSGMGAGDWGDVLLMPTTGEVKVIPGSKENPDEGYRSRFSHEEETTSAGYYSVLLKDYAVKAELTVSTRAGFHRYTFPKSDAAHIIIDAGHGIRERYRQGSEIKIVSDTEIVGHRSSHGFVKHKNVYFCARFSKPFKASGTWNEENIKPDSAEDEGKYIGAFVDYETTENETIEVKVGISYTSIEQARLNLDTEIPGWNFDEIKKRASQTWNAALGKIEIETPEANDKTYNQNKKTTFYTALYHSLLFPATFSDVDGKYIGLDGQVHTAEDFTYLSDFSLWDTHRAEMPLLTLVEPQRNVNAIRTMLAQFEQGGWLPTPQQFGNSYTNDMIGDHPVAAIADAFQKGIAGFDAEEAYKAVRKNAMETPPAEHRSRGRIGLNDYLEKGYLPYDKVRESVSRTLEYAYNDWCVAQLAKALGKEDDYKLFMQRAANYKNVLDPETGLARPKDSEGNWLAPFNPTFVGHGDERHYTEANAWQYTWFVPHDVQGLIDFEGGRKNFISKLDTLFTMSSEVQETVSDVTGLIGQYAHGNEPSHHTLYLYDYAGAPWKTQELARKVMEELYHSGPDGLCGNEDMGQMSAWYVLSSMGFYPVAPGQNVYVIGSPEFSKVTVHLDEDYYNSPEFTIKIVNNSKDNCYIQKALFNDNPLNKTWFKHEDIKDGGTLVFQMGPEPNKSWGANPGDAPPSIKNEWSNQ
ncbi:glycoside hydrolase family 92 protein [Maribellus comscasis]|uniref:Glycoside hydrolase family 92 protein n=1 Tax=Maribellus comscasis TaxID=2681766 RepID=A0A6I6K0Q3_9BACT|nr:GH92 family glycosyl hydrolase [Maribellus comscasis]QGY47020.1 glycoside hydrolase family 92 protein [Maribellus comscasis]